MFAVAIFVGGFLVVSRGASALKEKVQEDEGLGFLDFLFPESEEEKEKKQISDELARQGELDAQKQKNNAEILRLEELATRADQDASFQKAEELRQQKSLVEAENALLITQIESFNLKIAQKERERNRDITTNTETTTDKQDATTKSQDAVNKIPREETDSGQTVTDKEPDTTVKGSQPDIEVSVGRDEIEEAIDKATNAKTRGQLRFGKQSFFSSGSGSQITVEADPSVTITGGGTAGDKPAKFTIFETKPMNLSDVLRIHPEFSASQARDFLSKQGIFSTDPRVAEIRKRKFEEFDFRSSTGSGQKIETVLKGGETKEQVEALGLDPRPRVSQEQLRAEELRSEETLKKIGAGESITAPKPKFQKRVF